MGWRTMETRIERLRSKIQEAPEETKRQIEQAIKEARSPSDRIRLLGLLVIASCTLGDFEGGERAWNVARSLKGSDMARAELLIQAAVLKVVTGRPALAERLIATARVLLQRVRRRPVGVSSASVRRHRWFKTLYAATYSVMGEICISRGDLREALLHGQEALSRANCRADGVRIFLSALSVIAVAIVKGAGRVDDIVAVLRQCDRAKLLMRTGRKSIPLAKLRWIRALCLARLGATRAAESILITVIEDLRSFKAAADAESAGQDLLWIVADRAGRYARARYLCRSLALPPSVLPPRPAIYLDTSPIGF